MRVKKMEQIKKRMVAAKAFGWGVLGSLGLLIFYFVTLFLVTKDLQHPWQQFLLFQPWMSFLVVGFGIQVGLFSLLKSNNEARAVTGAGAGVSGVSMAACCAHHVVDVLPLLGATGLAVFLGEYQKELLIFGVVANLIGIGVMIRLIKRSR
jgi:hypothetical protein